MDWPVDLAIYVACAFVVLAHAPRLIAYFLRQKDDVIATLRRDVDAIKLELAHAVTSAEVQRLLDRQFDTFRRDLPALIKAALYDAAPPDGR